MQRQLWIYLLDDEDEAALMRAIESAKPGSVVAPGRFVRGDAPAILRGELGGLEFHQLGSRELHRLVFHKDASSRLTTHAVEEGPLAGAQSIDATHSECLHLVRPKVIRGMLEPSKLFGATHVQRGEQKIRKTPGFTLWLAGVHRAVKAAFPKSGVDFILLAPRARAWAEAGEGQLTYLYQPVTTAPKPAATPMTTPQKRQR